MSKGMTSKRTMVPNLWQKRGVQGDGAKSMAEERRPRGRCQIYGKRKASKRTMPNLWQDDLMSVPQDGAKSMAADDLKGVPRDGAKSMAADDLKSVPQDGAESMAAEDLKVSLRTVRNLWQRMI